MIRETSSVSDQAQVFVSYARLDAEQVIAIVRLLEQEGITVWRDGDRILGGQSWSEAITHAIAHSRVFLLMCSPHSLASDNVHQEVALAWAHECRRYIPVWLSPAMPFPKQIQYELVRCQWIDAHAQPPERWLPQLIEALENLGVGTKNRARQPGDVRLAPTPTPKPAGGSGEVEPGRRGLRFRPGDRPIRGADWELEILLGKGGFGEVWKARHPDLPGLPPVALKFCLQLDEKSRGLLRHEADIVLRAQQQLRTSASASGIVPLLNAHLNNDPPCLEYPYIEGGTLVRLIDECRQSTGSLKPAQAQQIVKRVAQIVNAAHSATPKLVHRDLKPSNILVERRPDGKIILRVTDFGIGGLAAQPMLERSRSESLQENMASVLTGAYSPLYASPQQVRGDKPDPRDDVYALGVIWYQLLTGDLTTPAPTGRRWVDELLRQGMSDAAVELLSSCFERNPAHRPDDAGVLADRLDTLPRSASAKPADAATELPIREGEAPSEPVLRRSAIDREGEAPSEPVLRPGDKNRKGDARMEPASPPGALTPIPARTEPRPPGALQAEFVPRGQRPQATAISARSRPGSGWSGVSQRWVAAGLLGLAGLLGVIVYIATDKGTIKITGSDPRMTVRIDGRGYRIENLGQPITFQAGQHELVVKRDGLEFKTKSFQIRRGMETVLDVTYTEDDPSGAWPPKPPDSRRAETNLSTAVPSNPESHAEAPAPSDPESITTRVGQIKLKRIPAGKFLMGSPDGDGDTDEHPQHEVRITRPFYLGVTEVTRGQFRLFVDETGYKTEAEKDGKGGYGWNEEAKKFEQSPRFTWQNPGFEQTDEHPVVNVTWNDAQEFVKWLSQKEGRIYRLPTEAEWEYACRAGTKTAYVSGDDAESLAAFGNIADGTAKEKYPEWTTIAARDGYVYTAPVGRFRANAFGLYDMHGNVWEWCQDWYDAEYYKQSPGDDPRGPPEASYRVIRGGCWHFVPGRCRSADRFWLTPENRDYDLGFRLVLVQSGR